MPISFQTSRPGGRRRRFVSASLLVIVLLVSIVAVYPLSFTSVRTKTSLKILSGRSVGKVVACCFAQKLNNQHYSEEYNLLYKDELVYNPNFNRHLVIRKTYNETTQTTKQQVLQSFEWLDEAQAAYPNATLKSMDLPPPPPPPSLQSQDKSEREWQALLSRIVAGAGLEEDSVYYRDKADNYQNPAPTNGGSYLLRFLQKVYSSLPTLTPAEVHRGVMDKFPRISFYDSALIHERLFFLLSPLPPENVLVSLRDGAVSAKKNNNVSTKNESAVFDTDFPVLFFEHGYGAGLTQAQLIQALQTIPQFWLPIYLSDASCSLKKPQEFLPYIFYHLNAHPEVLNEIRKELDPLLTGALPADVACLAHAKSSLRLSLDQCRVLLHALPTMLSCDIEPSWEFYGRGPIRSTLPEDALIYLRLRLQLTPSQVYGLLKTHTRLSTYKVQAKVKPALDAIQSKLGLSSRELQQIVLRMPSLIGSSESNLDDRIEFFTGKVGMTIPELRKSILRIPALSQYAITSLEAKRVFFQEDLQISDPSALRKIFVSQPVLWGLSLERNLKPTASSLGAACGMSLAEVGDVISRVPEILLLNWNSNLRPKIDFLVTRLNLQPSQLNEMVMAVPRVLVQSIHNSLEVKINFIETKLSQSGYASVTVQGTILSAPSLLLLSLPRLEKRFSKESKRKQLSDLIENGTAKRKGKPVLEIALDDSVVQKFSSGKEAARAASVSMSTMYNAVRTGRILRGKRYVYRVDIPKLVGIESSNGSKTSAISLRLDAAATETKALSIELNNTMTSTSTERLLKDIRRKRIQDDRGAMLMQSTHSIEDTLVVYASGRIFPPDNAFQVRGKRRAGGMAIAIPSLPKSFNGLFLKSCEKCFSGQLLSTQSCQTGDNDSGFVALLGYPYMRPSRRRCSLYVCREALRVIRQLFLEVAESSKGSKSADYAGGKVCPPPPMHVHVVTDSNYVFDLLQDTDELLEWGSKPSRKDFVYTGKDQEWTANIDILYPLSRTYFNLVKPEDNVSVSSLPNNLTVTFMLDEGTSVSGVNRTFLEHMGLWAREAAQWQYKRSR